MSDNGPERPTRLTLRLLGVLAAALLLLALIVAITRDRNPAGDAQDQSAPIASASEVGEAAASVTPSPSPVVVDLSVLDSPDAAEAAGAPAVLEAGRIAASDAWLDLTDPAWHHAMDAQRPVYVGEVVVSEDRSHVDFDIAVAVPAIENGLVRLRFLPGADVLGAAGADAEVRATADGAPVEVETDGTAALLTLALPQREAGDDPVLLRLLGSYDVPSRSLITDDGGPAGFGLLARSADVTMLGHGLPLLTFDPGPMLRWGDVGAFPVAVWSLEVRGPGVVATAGVESGCPTVAEDCLLSRGTALRDLAIAVFDDDATFGKVDGTGVYGGGSTSPASIDSVLEETMASLDAIASRVGPLPWGDVDVVLAPLTGAAGMEFPGLVIVDPEYLDRLGGGFGTFVIAHEVAHQWFHALLGNSSLSDPVVDESLAQYASLWYYRDVLGQAAADGIVDRHLVGRYLGGRDNGVVDVAPASPLADFGSNRVYGPMTYARAPLGWVVAEGRVGEAAVVAFLADLVARHGLGEVTSSDVRALAVERGDEAIVEAIDRWWFDPAPAHDEVP